MPPRFENIKGLSLIIPILTFQTTFSSADPNSSKQIEVVFRNTETLFSWREKRNFAKILKRIFTRQLKGLLGTTGTGRHNKTPENLRICSLCHLNEIEDELHFLFSCHHYNDIRKKFFTEINIRYQNFNDLDNNSKILFLFNSVDPFVCRTIAAYIYDLMLIQQSMLI